MEGFAPDSLPLNLDCEKALLCSCIKDAHLLDEPAIETELFVIPAHRIIFERLRELFEHGSSFDFLLFKNFLDRSGELAQAGGPQYLDQLWEFVPTSANWKHYRQILAEVRSRRLGILSCSELLKELADPQTQVGPDLTERFSAIQRRLEATMRVQPSCLEALSQSQAQLYKPPAGSLLVGDCHIVKGSVFVLGGPPGVGKSRAALALAEAGACGYGWFKLAPKAIFKTLIIQNENGRLRLKLEYAQLDSRVEHLVRVTTPPPLGLAFNQAIFRRDLARLIVQFEPDLIIIDPWNAVARDDKSRDYLESFDLIRNVVGSSDQSPGIGIVAHTRKPLPGERSTGRGLMNLLAGSYVLSSIPRSIWVMQHATESVTDERVIVTNCKNNDGALAPRGCFQRMSGQWPEITDFDWQNWDHPQSQGEKDNADLVDEDLIRQVLSEGPLKPTKAVQALMKLTGCKRAWAFRVFTPKGRFGYLLKFDRKNGTVFLGQK